MDKSASEEVNNNPICSIRVLVYLWKDTTQIYPKSQIEPLSSYFQSNTHALICYIYDIISFFIYIRYLDGQLAFRALLICLFKVDCEFSE